MTIREVTTGRRRKLRPGPMPQPGPIARRPFDPQQVRDASADAAFDGGMLPGPKTSTR